MEEIWKKLEGYKYNYEVSNFGRIRKGKLMLTQIKHHRGHLRVALVLPNGKIKQERVHRLVALAFIPNDNPEEKIYINHINMDMTDNRVENLEWCTPSYNVSEGIRLNNNRAKSYPLEAINKITGEKYYFERMTDAENFVKSFREVKTPRTPIRDAATGRLKSAYGYYWKFIKK